MHRSLTSLHWSDLWLLHLIHSFLFFYYKSLTLLFLLALLSFTILIVNITDYLIKSGQIYVSARLKLVYCSNKSVMGFSISVLHKITLLCLIKCRRIVASFITELQLLAWRVTDGYILSLLHIIIYKSSFICIKRRLSKASNYFFTSCVQQIF